MSRLLVITHTALIYREVISIAPKSIPATPRNTVFIRLAGTVGYTVRFNTVQIRVEKIAHNNKSTGTMKLVLWAVESYNGSGAWRGVRVAEIRLEQCNAGECYSGLQREVSRTSPNPGSYTIILALEVFSNGSFTRVDYRVFDKKCTFTKDAKLLGTCDYTVQDNLAEMRVEKISHNFPGKTGTLKLILWASAQGVNGGTWTGYKLAKTKIDPLENNYSYTNLKRSVGCKKPPSGVYFVILQLKSYTANGWISHDFTQFNSLASFA